MLRARVLVPLLLLLTVAGAPALAEACRCMPRSAEAALADAAAVFKGTITNVGEREGRVAYDVRVDGWWKGDPGREVVVTSGRDSCGVSLGAGTSTTFWAAKDGEVFTINACSGPGGEPGKSLDELATFQSYGGDPPTGGDAPKPESDAPKPEAAPEAAPVAPAEAPKSGGCAIAPSPSATALLLLAGGLVTRRRRRA